MKLLQYFWLEIEMSTDCNRRIVYLPTKNYQKKTLGADIHKMGSRKFEQFKFNPQRMKDVHLSWLQLSEKDWQMNFFQQGL